MVGFITWVLIVASLLSGAVLFLAQLFLFFSVILLIWEGSDMLVASSQKIAEHFNVSPFLVGLTIVAFGTSIPELVTSMVAGFGGRGDIAVANVVGSNILNISVILGGLAFLTKGGLAINRQTIRFDAPVLIFGSLLALLFLGAPSINTNLLDSISTIGLLNLKLDFAEAVVLIVLFAIYLYIIIVGRNNNRTSETTTDMRSSNIQQADLKRANNKERGGLVSHFVRTVAGLTIVMIGCHLLVGKAELIDGTTQGYGAVWFANFFGIPDFLIGLSIVALGTSAPEIVVSLSAARSNAVEIGIGNLLGSAIFNIFAVLGIAGLFVQPPLAESITINVGAVQSLMAMGLLFVVVLVFLSTSTRLSRKEGLILFLLGVTYMAYEMIETISYNDMHRVF